MECVEKLSRKAGATAEADRPRAVKLQVIKHGERRDCIDLPTNGAVTLGRKGDKADVVVEHKTISARHAAVVVVSAREVYIVDLDSSKHTFVNGKKIRRENPVQIWNGDEVEFGLCSKKFKLVVKEKREDQHGPRPAVEEERRESNSTEKDEEGRIRRYLNEEERSREERQAAIRLIAESMANSKPVYKPSLQDLGEGKETEKEGETNVVQNLKLPISQQVTLKEHAKPVCSVSVDRSGSRIVSGSYDFQAAIWDFNGMTTEHLPFKVFTPLQGHVVHKVRYSPIKGSMLVLPADAKARVHDHNGEFMVATAKGDPYIYDMSKTKGHPSAITDGCWHSTNANLFFTSGLDGTCRIWDINGPTYGIDSDLLCTSVLKARSARNAKIEVNSCDVSPSGDSIVVGASDSSVQGWDLKASNKYSSPNLSIRPDNSFGKTLCLRFSPSGIFLATRHEEGGLSVYDTRQTKSPLLQFNYCLESTTDSNVCFSPDGKLLIAGDASDSTIHFVDLASGKLAHKHLLMDQSSGRSGTICVEWSPEINQIIVGCADGTTRVLFDEDLSCKGAILSSAKAPKKKDVTWAVSNEIDLNSIILPTARRFMPKSGTTAHRTKDQQERAARKDKLLTRMPAERPRTAEDMITSTGGEGGSFFRHVVRDQLGIPDGQVDYREEILKHASTDERDPKRPKFDPTGVSLVYAQTQPKTILASRTLEEEEDEINQTRKDLAAFQRAREGR